MAVVVCSWCGSVRIVFSRLVSCSNVSRALLWVYCGIVVALSGQSSVLGS